MKHALIGLDLDGVVVRPPLGMNIAISRRLDDTPPRPFRNPTAVSRRCRHQRRPG